MTSPKSLKLNYLRGLNSSLNMDMFNLKPMKVPKMKLPSTRRMLPNKREQARAMGMRVREPISASLRKQVLARAKNVCQAKGCIIKHSDFPLEIHHKDMNNDNTKLSNLSALCSLHHKKIHRDNKKISEKDIMGRQIKSKVVSKKKAVAMKKVRKQQQSWSLYG